MATTAGYSGTPLARKIGVTEGMSVCVRFAPDEYQALLQPLPPGVVFEADLTPNTGLIHVFVTDRDVLLEELTALRKTMPPSTPLWVSWPKKSSKRASTVTEDVVRAVALPLGLVDIKVCAVSDIWSGLKLVVRKGLR